MSNTKTQKEIEKQLLLNFFAYSTTSKGEVILHSETEREKFDKLFNFIKSLLSSHAEQIRKEERERIFSVIKPVFEDWAVQSQYITGSWLHGNPTAWEQFSKQFDNKLANTEIKQALSSTEQGEGK